MILECPYNGDVVSRTVLRRHRAQVIVSAKRAKAGEGTHLELPLTESGSDAKRQCVRIAGEFLCCSSKSVSRFRADIFHGGKELFTPQLRIDPRVLRIGGGEGGAS